MDPLKDLLVHVSPVNSKNKKEDGDAQKIINKRKHSYIEKEIIPLDGISRCLRRIRTK